MTDFQLVVPQVDHLPGYIAALEQGWSPDNLRPEAAAAVQRVFGTVSHTEAERALPHA